MKSIKNWRIIFLASFAAYLSINIYLYFLFQNDSGVSLSIGSALSLLAAKILPIIVFVPAVIKPNYKASLFLCLILLFYIALLANAMFIEGLRGNIAIAEGFIIGALFSAAIVLGKLHKE